MSLIWGNVLVAQAVVREGGSWEHIPSDGNPCREYPFSLSASECNAMCELWTNVRQHHPCDSHEKADVSCPGHFTSPLLALQPFAFTPCMIGSKCSETSPEANAHPHRGRLWCERGHYTSHWTCRLIWRQNPQSPACAACTQLCCPACLLCLRSGRLQPACNSARLHILQPPATTVHLPHSCLHGTACMLVLAV